jgi:hypothetical protein
MLTRMVGLFFKLLGVFMDWCGLYVLRFYFFVLSTSAWLTCTRFFHADWQISSSRIKTEHRRGIFPAW